MSTSNTHLGGGCLFPLGADFVSFGVRLYGVALLSLAAGVGSIPPFSLCFWGALLLDGLCIASREHSTSQALYLPTPASCWRAAIFCHIMGASGTQRWVGTDKCNMSAPVLIRNLKLHTTDITLTIIHDTLHKGTSQGAAYNLGLIIHITWGLLNSGVSLKNED